MTKERTQAALVALDRIENDALSCRDGYGETTKDAETIRAALQSAPISETQLESEIKKTAMSETQATPVPSNINDNITITMDSKGRMLMKLKPEDEDTPMTNIDQLVQELEGKFYDVSAYDIRQIIKYLHSHGYLGVSPEKNIRTFFDAWFVFDGDVNGLVEFCDALNWNSFKKGGKDKKGNFIIFLFDGNKTIGAIRSRSTKLHLSALNYLMGHAELKGE